MSTSKQRRSYRVGPSSKRRCWTCRERKISCDMGRPGCRNCAASSRICQGYGLRLSWPANGSSRSIHSSAEEYPPEWPNNCNPTHFINTFMTDIDIHYLQYPGNIAILPPPSMWIPPLSNLTNAQPAIGDGDHLLSFFMIKVVTSFAPIGSDGYKLWKLLFQLSFSDDSPASMAVLRAILALASLYRHGHGKETLRLKVAALSSLATSMKELTTGTREIYQHVAVDMLLCAFEIFVPSETSFQWPLYLSGAKIMLHEICDEGHPKLIEFDVLILWVHYHDILGKFTSRHWKVNSSENASIFKVPGMASNLASVERDQVLSIFGCSMEMINLIARMSEIQLDSKTSLKHHDADRGALHSIEREMTIIQQDTTDISETNNPEEAERGRKMATLYQLAGLIYFERVMKRYSDGKRLERWATEGFNLLRDLIICERPFPLFFIACEAYTDIQRELILSVLEKTQRNASQRKLYVIRSMIESMWVQRDLISDSNGEGNTYSDTLNTIMSSIELLPTLA